MINEFGFDGNIIAWYKDFLKGRKTRVKYKKYTSPWRDSLENLPQGQTDSTILFDLMINYVNLNDVDKIVKDLERIDTNDENTNVLNEIIEDKLDIHSDSEEEKADVLEENIITKGNNINDTNYNEPNKIKKQWNRNIDLENVELNPNLINDDDKTIHIEKFKIELKNFADDCTLEMNPILRKEQLTKYIKIL